MLFCRIAGKKRKKKKSHRSQKRGEKSNHLSRTREKKTVANCKKGKVSGQLQAQENHSPIVCRAKSITNRKRGKTISHRSQALGLQVMNDNNWKLMVFMRMC